MVYLDLLHLEEEEERPEPHQLRDGEEEMLLLHRGGEKKRMKRRMMIGLLRGILRRVVVVVGVGEEGMVAVEEGEEGRASSFSLRRRRRGGGTIMVRRRLHGVRIFISRILLRIDSVVDRRMIGMVDVVEEEEGEGGADIEIMIGIDDETMIEVYRTVEAGVIRRGVEEEEEVVGRVMAVGEEAEEEHPRWLRGLTAEGAVVEVAVGKVRGIREVTIDDWCCLLLPLLTNLVAFLASLRTS